MLYGWNPERPSLKSGRTAVQTRLSRGRRLAALDRSPTLDAYKEHDKQPVITIDERHLLSTTMVEEIRFLTNFQTDAASPMALILVG